MKKIFLLYTITLLSLLAYNQNVRIIPPIGHTGQITDVDMSNDGKYIISSSVDKTIVLWDYLRGREIAKLSGTDYGATCCVFDNKHKTIFSAGWDGFIRKWDLETQEEEIKWQAYTNGVNNIELIPGNKHIASIGKDGVLKIWTTKDGELLKEIKVSDFACNAIATSKKKNLLAIGDQGGNIVLINTKDYNLIDKIKLHDSFVTSISFTEDGELLASSSYDYKVKVINSKSLEVVNEFTDSYQMWTEVSISPRGDKLAALSMNGLLYEWSLISQELIQKKETGFQMGTALTYNLNANEIVACGATNTISVFRSVEGVKIKFFTGSTSPIEGVDMLSKKSVVSSVHWDSRIRVFDMYKCKLISSKILDNHILSDLFLSRKSDKSYVASVGRKVEELNYKTQIVTNLLKSSSAINAMAYSNSESYMAIACSDSTIYLYDINDKSEILQVKHRDNPMDVCFSNDNKYLLSAGRDSLLIITDIQNKESKKIILKSKAESVAISSDDLCAAIGLWTGEIAIVDLSNVNSITYIKPHNWIVSSLDFSPINDYLLSASWDKNIAITDWRYNIETARYKGHTGSVTSSKFSDDGKYVISGGWDNQIKILDSRDLDEICSVIPVDEEDYLILTPDFYYMGTTDAAKKVSFSIGLQTYSFEQFDLQYNRPDKVIESLPFANKDLIPIYKKAYEKRLLKTGFNQNFFNSSYTAPEIEIANLNDIDLYTDKESIVLNLIAKDSVNFIDRYNIYINGVSVFGMNGKDTRKDNKHEVKVREKIKLGEGLNQIEVSALSTTGVESYRQTLEVFYSPESQSQKNIHLISLAVAEYDNSAYNLRYTINDGRAIVNAFKEMEAEYNLIVDTLFGKDCTIKNFEEIREKLLLTNVDDIVIIHFSGHGLLDSDGNFYFATYDVDFSNPSENGLQYDLIEGIMDGIPARNKLVLLDACHSGELDTDTNMERVDQNEVSQTAMDALAAKGVVMYNVPGADDIDDLQNSFDLMMNYFADVRKGTGTVVISAATGSGFALEVKKLKHGVFTYVLLEGLQQKHADTNNDKAITVGELREYIFENVLELSEGYQRPTTRKDNLQNDFIIFRY